LKNLKEKTINGLLWSFFESFSNKGIQLVVGIILARILDPKDFGLIGLTTIFITFSKSFTDSGLTSALIRKQDCTQKDYATVFVFNLVIAVCIYFLIFIGAGFISRFFEEEQLKNILIVSSLGIVLQAFGAVQQSVFIKKLDFKLLTKISFTATLISGFIAIIMALNGFGVWSLVALFLGNLTIYTLLLWFFSKWKPSWLFDKNSFNELFGFGKNLLFSSLIAVGYNTVFRAVISKSFSIEQLGFFDRSNRFQLLISENFGSIINKVSYPSLSKITKKERLKNALSKLIKNSMFITFLAMFGLAAVAKPFILVLIGEKWSESIVYLQLLIFAGVFYPIHVININFLKVYGRSDLILKIELIKKLIAIPMLIATAFISVKAMIVSMIILSMIELFINGYYTQKFINYTIREQLLDIFPSFILASVMGILVYFIGGLFTQISWYSLFIQIVVGLVFVILVSEFLKQKEYLQVKKIIFEKLNSL